MIMEKIEFYKKILSERGISQYRLAKMCGCTAQQINAYFNKKVRLGNIMEERINKALNIKIEWNYKEELSQ